MKLAGSGTVSRVGVLCTLSVRFFEIWVAAVNGLTS